MFRTGCTAACRLLTLVTLLVLAFASTGAHAAPPLKRGVNIAKWFNLDGTEVITSGDLTMLKSLGFDHVRVPVDPQLLGWQPDAPEPDLPGLTRLDQGIQAILDAKLDVILDLHLSDALMARLGKQPELEDRLVRLWRRLAEHYRPISADRLVFEVLNEPAFVNQAHRWQAFARLLVTGVRSSAPDHTIILSGAAGGGIEGLLAFTPVEDPKVIYSFHFYLPYLFTHQGADWQVPPDPVLGYVGNVAYPSSMAKVNAISIDPGASWERVTWAIGRYMAEGWDKQRLAKEVDRVVKWRNSHTAAGQPVKVICTEYGVYRARSDAASRRRWLGDVAEVLETAGIGWTVWEYSTYFAIAEKRGPLRVIDPETAFALRLHKK